MDNSEKSNKITASLIISILAFLVSLSTFIYTIYKDNKESITLLCSEYKCIQDENDGYRTSGTYIIINNSHKTISITDAYILYDGTRIRTGLDESDVFPINLSSGESYQIAINSEYSSYKLSASFFELRVISSSQKQYSTKSKYL